MVRIRRKLGTTITVLLLVSIGALVVLPVACTSGGGYNKSSSF